MASIPAPTNSSGLLYPLPVTERAPGQLFAIFAIATIAAAPATVLDAILDYQAYGKWNTFMPHVTITSPPPHASSTGPPDNSRLQVGTRFTGSVFLDSYDFSGTVKPTAGTQTPLLLTSLGELKDGRKGYEIRWIPTQFPSWLLHSERVHSLVETEDGQTRYSSKETFGGWLSWVILWFLARELVLRFQDWGMDLKGYVERQKLVDH